MNGFFWLLLTLSIAFAGIYTFFPAWLVALVIGMVRRRARMSAKSVVVDGFVIGLYNRYGRLFTDIRRGIFRLTGGRARWIDPVLRRGGIGAGKRKAWFADQYEHPHESVHTVDEVLGWFDGEGLEFVRGVPSVTPYADDLAGGDLFASRARGSGLERMLAQAQTVVTGNREGGFFLMIARKPAEERVGP